MGEVRITRKLHERVTICNSVSGWSVIFFFVFNIEGNIGEVYGFGLCL